MIMRMLRRFVYFGIPVFMWVAGAACVAEQQHVQQAKVSYRCSRVGCDKTADGVAGGAAPNCSCGSSMVLDSAEDGSSRLNMQKK